MTQIDLQTVRQMAELARLSLDERETQALAEQFARILAQFRALEELDLGSAQPADSGAAPPEVLRADLPGPSLTPDAALANAPQRIEDFYGVPKTVGGEA